MDPSNFRYNPYDDISTGVIAKELHIIPNKSPYIIRLNEVPQKSSPSSTAVKEVTSAASSGISYGKTFAEVAAIPAVGEFWLDYNTGANKDDNWNTGLIQFNAADAGKIIEVSYTATGILAAVNTNHWPDPYTDRGDGSDGDFYPADSTNISGIKNYKNVYIKEGITVSINRYAKIKCQGAFVNHGIITAASTGGKGRLRSEREGYSGGKTPADNVLYCSGNGGTGGRAGYSAVWYNGGAGGTSYLGVNGDFGEIVLGAGGGVGAVASNGGDGGTGGGCIRITASEFTNTGTITADGASGTSATSGPDGNGGGGLIKIVANTINNTGEITANGGAGGLSTAHSGHGTADGTAGSNGICELIELGAM
ncbi:hypothetical protein [Phascolarctobacterium faecium]|uniref:hypothetical protein n=1 Tax=Phascolarctobacterium faecium TaxID=33025 RepID=UPI000F0C5F2D|nr:hypothetical protein [Phascolarctobacterium faecium]BBG64277.1 hypothetical protein PFJ30894_01928 [Phascolarctobacterium faecium]